MKQPFTSLGSLALGTILVSFGTGAIASAQTTTGVQFYSFGRSPDSQSLPAADTAGVVPTSGYDVLDAPNSGDSSQTFADGLTVTVANLTNSYYTGTASSSSASANNILLSSQVGVYNSATSATYTFSGSPLSAGQTYNVYAYTVTNADGVPLTLNLTTGSAAVTSLSDTEQNGSDFTGTFIQGSSGMVGNYIEFTGVTPSSTDTLAFALPNPDEAVSGTGIGINAFEFQPVAAAPEPSGWSLILGSLAVLLLVRKVRSRSA